MLTLDPKVDFPRVMRGLDEDRYDIVKIAEASQIDREVLQGWLQGDSDGLPWQAWALINFCARQRRHDLIRPYAPSYDWSAEFSFGSGPLDPQTPLIPYKDLDRRPKTIAGFEVNFPFGISASVLTRNRNTVEYYSRLGYDLITFMSVRSAYRHAHPHPNFAYIPPRIDDPRTTAGIDIGQLFPLIHPPFRESLVGNLEYVWRDPRHVTVANSFGIPSLDPETGWKPEVEKAKQSLFPGQVLIVSVIGTPAAGDWDAKSDFVSVARDAKEAGAHIVEANFAWPSDSPAGAMEDLLYRKPAVAGGVAKAMKAAIGDTPLFVKIGYLERDSLQALIAHLRPYVQGIVAINALRMQVVTHAGSPFFKDEQRRDDRGRAGIGGVGIRPWARKVVEDLVTIRDELHAEDEFAIVAVGGVSTAHDVTDYLNLGADAVQCCTAADRIPLLATEVRIKPIDISAMFPDNKYRPPAVARETDVMSKEWVDQQQKPGATQKSGNLALPPDHPDVRAFVDGRRRGEGHLELLPAPSQPGHALGPLPPDHPDVRAFVDGRRRGEGHL